MDDGIQVIRCLAALIATTVPSTASADFSAPTRKSSVFN